MGCCGSKQAGEQPNTVRAKGISRKHADDEYKVTKVLGVGASCKVVIAVSKKTREKFAMKILNKVNSESADNEFLFKNETKILSQLKHPNIVEFVEAFEDDETYNLVTVLCTGGELFDRVAEGSFSEKVASSLALQMLKAIKHCHDHDIVHRDLKPENFVFDTADLHSNMKLIDFGCAVKAADDETIHDVAGSPYYVAPEILAPKYRRTGRVWKASDMWSIGVIIFLLVHGYPPFNGEKQQEIFRRISKGRYKFSKDINLSVQVKDLIQKLLIMDPMKRLTADQALAHPWVAGNVAPDTPLSKLVTDSLGAFRAQCRLKKAVARVMANRLTEDDKASLAALFKEFDLNGDGQLGPDEIAAMMKKLGKTETEAKEFMEQVDENGDGVVSIDEFATFQQMGKMESRSEAELKAAFELFDKDKDGYVTHEEIEKLCGLDASVAKQMIREVDQNGDGRITLDEWLQALREKSQHTHKK